MASIPELKRCPFCGGGAVLIVAPKAIRRGVWIECSECRITTPVFEYAATDDFEKTCERLGEVQRQAKTFWNTRAR